MKRFADKADRDELVNDAVSVAWEMAMNATNSRNGHPGTVATFAVRRVASRRQFAESERDLTYPAPRRRRAWRQRKLHPEMDAVGSQSIPADAASFRVDFDAWLSSLTERRREVAELLGSGHTMREIAERSGCTTNAVRMIRMALRRSYQAFFNGTDELNSSNCD